MDSASLKSLAVSLGFDRAGVARLRAIPDGENLRAFLAEERHGTMEWMRDGVDRRADAAAEYKWARSVVVVAMGYKPGEEPPRGPETGLVARYARGEDYHRILKDRLETLAEKIRAGGHRSIPIVDTAHFMEKPWAREAGIGWIGKNTCSIDPRGGSYFAIGAILTAAELEPDQPAPDHCGSCNLCLDACPTQALTEPYRMDASRCISYLTIEHRGPIDERLRDGMGAWVFGCDICQEVCPWNAGAPATAERTFEARPTLAAPRLGEWLELQAEAFQVLKRGTALRRAKRSMLRRNAAIAMGNSGDVSAIPALKLAAQDADPMVAEAASWAARKLEKP